ncbi:uncharacterized protein LOC143040170 [Oratosquilla oratoria]|uniref:uncharacterized protein LOC143040170 n=1 Tax=Oratosquilla oratoria TaxID=337810 RepID=UPI003F762A2E
MATMVMTTTTMTMTTSSMSSRWMWLTTLMLHVTWSGLILAPLQATVAAASPLAVSPSSFSRMSPLFKMPHLSSTFLQAMPHPRHPHSSSSIDEKPSYTPPLLIVDTVENDDSAGSVEVGEDAVGGGSNGMYDPLDDLYFTQLMDDMSRQLKNSRHHRSNLRQKRFSYEEEEAPRTRPSYAQDVVVTKRALGLLMSLKFRNPELRPHLALLRPFPKESSLWEVEGGGGGREEGVQELVGDSKRHRPHGLLRWGR